MLKCGIPKFITNCLSLISCMENHLKFSYGKIQSLPNLEITEGKKIQTNKNTQNQDGGKEDITGLTKGSNMVEKGLQPTWKVPNSLSTAAFQALLRHWGF